jgi:hypothetical protein
MLAVPGGTNQEACGTSGNLPHPQVLELPKTSSGSQFTKREGSTEKAVRKQTTGSHKTLQIVYFDLSSARD